MWYDCLPALAAFVFVTYVPHVVNPYIELFFQGNRYYKNTDLPDIQKCWYRNMYLTGNGNKCTGVDAIPDLLETNTNKSA